MKIVLKNIVIVLSIVLVCVLNSLLAIGLERWFGIVGIITYLILAIIAAIVAFSLKDFAYEKKIKEIKNRYK